jgi:hypothetical protein
MDGEPPVRVMVLTAKATAPRGRRTVIGWALTMVVAATPERDRLPGQGTVRLPNKNLRLSPSRVRARTAA